MTGIGAERAFVADDNRSIVLTLYRGAEMLGAAALDPVRTIGLAGELIAAAQAPDEMMITIAQRPLEDARTPENSCVYIAAFEIDGRRFEACSRRGAPAELARAPVAAGIIDQPVEVRKDGRVRMHFPSLYRLAGYTWGRGRSAASPGPVSPAAGPSRSWCGAADLWGEAPVPAGSPSLDPLPAIAAG